MATVNFFDSFTYKWAQAGNVYAWDDAQYKQGWATVGAVPPSVEQFNRVHQVQDEKINWIYSQIQTAAASRGVTLTAADVTGLRQILDNVLASVPEATMTVAGKTSYATIAEVQAGGVTTKAITPAGLDARIATLTRTGMIELATAAEAQAFLFTDRAITPASLREAFLGANSNITGNGYQKFPSGLILQWMSTSSGPTGQARRNWPLVFPTAYLAGVVSEAAGGADVDNTVGWTLSGGDRFGVMVNCHRFWNGGQVQRLGNAAGMVIALGV